MWKLQTFYDIYDLYMIFGINTTRDISKLSQISLTWRLVKLRITILKYQARYLCQISRTNHATSYTNNINT